MRPPVASQPVRVERGEDERVMRALAESEVRDDRRHVSVDFEPR
jgi:hypothetical protein